MYFLKHYKENPDFLNNYLKYYSIIELSAETSVDEAYFDLRSFFRYLKLNKSDENIYDQELIKNIKIVMKKKEKVNVSISVDRKLDNYMNEMFENKSKYIEWLIEQDLLKSGVDLKNIIL